MQIMRFALMIWAIVALLLSANAQKHSHFAGNRTTMVHLFEWTWATVARECRDYLGPFGFGGVQISPPNEARVVAGRPWWERYQPISYLLTSRSGTEEQLRHMIAACNEAGVRVYVDVVMNHMTGASANESCGTAGSVGDYQQHSYPAVPYGPDDFNAPCSIANYNDPVEVRNCQLNSLLDLNQGKPHVRTTIANYMNRLIDMGAAGFRIDAAKHMWPDDLNAIYARLHNLRTEFGFPRNARPYIFQEVIDLGGETIKKTDYNQAADVTEFKHSAEIGATFRGLHDLKWLKNWGPAWSFLPSADALVFVDNHDNQRGHGAGGASVLTHKDGDRYKMALVFMLSHPYGDVVRVMSSYTFSDTDQGPPCNDRGEIIAATLLPDGQCNTAATRWVCEHRWREIANMVEFRNVVGDSGVTNWWDNGKNQIAFERTTRGFVAFNMEAEKDMKVELRTDLPEGVYCDVVSGLRDKQLNLCTARNVTVRNDGMLTVELPKGPGAMAIHLNSKI